MTYIQSVNTGTVANDGTGDPLRTAFTKINSSLKTLRSDISTAPHAVLVGDSMTLQNTDLGSPKNAYHSPRGFFTWLQVRLGFPFDFVVGNNGPATVIGDNRGVSGDTTTGILARLDNDVLARNPDIVFVWAGTNDITSGASYATITGNLASIYQKILDRGGIVAVLPIMPRNSSGTDWGSTAQRRLHLAVNHWIENKARTTQGIVYIDPYPYFIDPTSANGEARSGFTVDGVHCSPTSAYYMGEAAIKVFSSLIRPMSHVAVSQYDAYDATNFVHGNMLTNGLLTGTSGTVGTGASGTAATGWQVFRNSGTSVTVAASKVSRSDGMPGDVQQMVISTTGTGGTGIIYMAPSPSTTTAGVASDIWVEGCCEIEVSASTGGGSPLFGIYLDVTDQTTGGSRMRCLPPYTGTKFPNVAWKGILKTPPLQLIGTDGIRFRVIAEVDETVTDSFTVKLSRMTLRRRLTAPAF